MATAITHPGVTANDRLSFTLFLAVALHAAVILGVTFTYLEKSPSAHTMEITLAQHRSKHPPDKSDFLAQFSQAGSGTLAEKALLTSPTKTQFHDTVIRETMPIQQTATGSTTVQKQKPVITTTATSTNKAIVENLSDSVKPLIKTIKGEKSLLQRSLEIASLEAKLDKQRQIYAKRPRIKRLTSLSTSSSSDAYYLNSWRRKIERVGNINYPAEARRKKLYGSLRLMVAVLPDGSLKEIKLLESSGHQVLDDSAIKIVRLASPFAPFPDELRKSTDLLEVIRTWQFRENSSLRSF
ncbi:MAG: protein TonB [Flavobacterium sp.]|jgi:protein TonB